MMRAYVCRGCQCVLLEQDREYYPARLVCPVCHTTMLLQVSGATLNGHIDRQGGIEHPPAKLEREGAR